MTHVGIICDRVEAQPQMPQFIIGNEHTFLMRDLRALQAGCPPNVTLLRQKSAWSNAVVTGRIFRALAAAVRSLEVQLGKLQVVLILDAVRIHYAPAALRACRAAGIFLVVVPAKLTFLLQPLDTHAFSQYKYHLKHAYQAARMTSSDADGDLNVREFLACVYSSIRYVLQGRRWSAAFNSDGFGAQQSGLGARVRRRLALEDRVEVPNTQPTDDQVRVCLPRRTGVKPSALWSLYRDPTACPVALRLVPARRPPAVAASRAALSLKGGPRSLVGRSHAASSSAPSTSRAPSVAPRVSDVGAEPPVIYGKTRAETARLKAAPGLFGPAR